MAQELPTDGPVKLYATPLVRENRSARARLTNWIAMREQGMTNVAIAEKMGISINTLNTLIRRATKEGWLIHDDVEDRFEHEIAPMIADVVKYHLERKSEKMAIEAAKGLGYFKSHQAVKTDEGADSSNLQLNIQINANGEIRPSGNVVGRPKMPDITVTPIEPQKLSAPVGKPTTDGSEPES